MSRPQYKEFRVQLQVRNNLLIERREQMGLSAPQASEKMDVSYGTYWQYESLKTSPISRRAEGGWKETALKIAKFYNTTPEVLWPAEVLLIENPKIEKEVGAKELQALTGGKKALEGKVGS